MQEGPQGMCLGVSPAHSTAVGCILNLRTGKISPQCHVVHDELFTTVQGRPQYDALDPATWNELLELGGREHGMCSCPLIPPRARGGCGNFSFPTFSLPRWSTGIV